MYKVDKWPQIILSVSFISGYFLVLYFLMSSNSDTSMLSDPVFTTILGVMTAAIPQILNFWFGSSSGSKDKQRNVSYK